MGVGCLQDFVERSKSVPLVIVTDQDNAIMNVVSIVFSLSTAFLCRYHVTKNVRAWLKPTVVMKEKKGEGGQFVKFDVMVKKIMSAWTDIRNSSTEEMYTENMTCFRNLGVEYPNFLKYVESTILDQVKEKVVYAWMDRVRRLGNTITNRVESAHVALKRWLSDSKGDLCRDWDVMNQMLINQYNKI